MNEAPENPDDGIRPLNSIERTGELLDLGTTSIYGFIGTGELAAVKVGVRTKILGPSIRRFIATRKKAQVSPAPYTKAVGAHPTSSEPMPTQATQKRKRGRPIGARDKAPRKAKSPPKSEGAAAS
jgi:hypothetical protein